MNLSGTFEFWNFCLLYICVCGCAQNFFMYNLVSFPIIPALLVSLKPLAQSWHTHMDLMQDAARMRTEIDTCKLTLEPWFGFMFVGLRQASSRSSTLRLAVLLYRRWNQKWADKKEKERERDGQDRELEQRQEERKLERKRWETFGQDPVKRSSDEDTRQRFGAKREGDGNKEKQTMVQIGHMRKWWNWGHGTSSVIKKFPFVQYKIQHLAKSMCSHLCVPSGTAFHGLGLLPTRGNFNATVFKDNRVLPAWNPESHAQCK